MPDRTDTHSRARHLYRYLRQVMPAAMQTSYLLHVPPMRQTWLGIGVSRLLSVRHDGLVLQEGGHQTRHALPDGDWLSRLPSWLNPERPVFFMISNDLLRVSRDPELPLAILVQPETELLFNAQSVLPAITPEHPDLSAHIQSWAGLEHSAPQQSSVDVNAGNDTEWRTEADADFLQRLQQAVSVLADVQGKMIITRAYTAEVAEAGDPFRLYDIYTGLESEPAASHFLNLPGGIASLGCSPENIFEIDHGRLYFDVVAATRGISADPDQDRRWLQELREDPKEIKEHRMALARYRQRLEGLCEPGSVREDLLMGVRSLHCVRHLHSRLSGQLRADITAFDLLSGSFPALSSYPPALIPLADPDTTPTLFYGGMLGRIGPGYTEAHCYLNLRAALIKGRSLHTQGGVGVIAESIPSRELLEVQNKLRCLMRAINVWSAETGTSGCRS